MSRLLLAVCALAFIGSARAESVEYKTNEQALETTSDLTLLPQRVPGTVTSRGCPQCAVVVLEATSDTTFIAGKNPIAAAELKKLATKNRNMAIFYDSRSKKALRIVVYGVSATDAKAVASEKRQ